MSKSNGDANDIEAFAANQTRQHRGTPCWCCSIPEAKEINEARLNGVEPHLIRKWLIEKRGYHPDIATVPRVSAHFHRYHHQRATS